MSLRFIAKDPESKDGKCPSVWVDDNTGEIVVQGWNAPPSLVDECLAGTPATDGETIVRLPASMAAALREACDVSERSIPG